MPTSLRLLGAAFLLAGLLSMPLPAAGQGAPEASIAEEAGAGTMDLFAWPDREQVAEWQEELDARWLPQFDRIRIDYEYALRDTVVDWQFELAWSPGDWVHAGEEGIRPLGDVAGPGRLEQIYLIAEAVVDGAPRATTLFAFEEMDAGPRPETVSLSWSNVPLQELFDGLDAEEARALLAEQPDFEIVDVERVQVWPPEAPPTAERSDRREQETRQERQPRADPAPPRTRRTSSVFVIRTGYVFGGTRTRTVARPPSATPAPEGDRTARGGRGDVQAESDEEPRRDRRRSRSDDDDDDAPSLGPAAMGAAAVVGLGAFVGGSVGVSGSSNTPIGITSGWTGTSGGVWLQAEISGAVLTGEGTERLGVQLRGFTDVGAGALQPALGLGLLFEQERGEIASRPIVSPGLVWNQHQIALMAGFDVVNSAPQMGVVYNFRAGD